MVESRGNCLPNSANALNVGIQSYKRKGFEFFSDLSEAHKDAIGLTQLMKKDLLFWKKYGQQVDIIDDKNTQNHLFKNIREEIDSMFNSTQGKGLNPYNLNFFSFCGHGLVNSSREAIFLVPQYNVKDDEWVIKTLNVDQEA